MFLITKIFFKLILPANLQHYSFNRTGFFKIAKRIFWAPEMEYESNYKILKMPRMRIFFVFISIHFFPSISNFRFGVFAITSSAFVILPGTLFWTLYWAFKNPARVFVAFLHASRYFACGFFWDQVWGSLGGPPFRWFWWFCIYCRFVLFSISVQPKTKDRRRKHESKQK